MQALIPLQTLHSAVKLRAPQPLDSVGCVAEQRGLLCHGQPLDDVPGSRTRRQGRVAERHLEALAGLSLPLPLPLLHALSRRAGPVNVRGAQADAHEHIVGAPVRGAGFPVSKLALEGGC